MYYGDPVNTTDKRHLDRAVQVALSSTCRNRHGVVIARGPRVLAVAVNSDRNHPTICTDPKGQAAYHAEVNALKQLKGVDLSRAVLYSARVSRSGEAAMAKPCPRCAKIIEDLGVRRVVWTT